MFTLRSNINGRLSALLLIGGLFLFPISSIIAEPLRTSEIINEQGSFSSPGGKYEAILRISDMGGFLTLSIVSKPDGRYSSTINDVTGIVWLDEDELLFSVSPIYGKPGIFIVACSEMKVKRILGPTTFNKAYPDGADYFEVKHLFKEKVYFYYTPDVDSTYFPTFRAKDHLYQINLDGTGFEKVENAGKGETEGSGRNIQQGGK